MEDLLFLVHRIPYPPNKGDKIRSFHILKYLSERYRVHLGAFIDREGDRKYEHDVAQYCAGLWLGKISRSGGKLRSLVGFLKREALTLPYYRQDSLFRWVDEVRRQYDIRRVLVYSSAMAQYVIGKNFEGVRRVIDFVDVDSDKWRQYSGSRGFPMSWVYQREATRLFAFERKVAAVFDASVFVSDAEVALFRRGVKGTTGNILAIKNGVDLQYFSPRQDRLSPYRSGETVCVFTGAMDYWANEEGTSWFAHRVLPIVRRRHPDAVFYIVGMGPTASVRALGRLPGVTVTGQVPDVRPYLQHASVVVVPLRIARGIQNKVLEAMAMGKAVVATSQALEGIAAEPERDVLLADDADAFGMQVLHVLKGRREGIGCSARELVQRDLAWEASLPKLVELLEGAV